MFEIMADEPAALRRFYSEVFGWHIDLEGGFGYVRFPVARRPSLGGIGQAQKGVVGYEKGVAFYLEVDAIDEALLARITAGGGSVAVPRTPVDGYVFAMFYDREKNLIGLIERF